MEHEHGVDRAEQFCEVMPRWVVSASDVSERTRAVLPKRDLAVSVSLGVLSCAEVFDCVIIE